MWCWDCLKQPKEKRRKFCRSETYGKRTGRMQVTHLQRKCLPQQGKMCWITVEINTELLLLHVSIISGVLLEFLILNFVPIIGRRLDCTSLYADGLVENCRPLTCFYMIKLERKMVCGILEHAMHTRHPNSLNPDNKVDSLGQVWRCHTACLMGISS